MKVFIPIKHHSARVPGKNFRMFGRMPLYKRCLTRFKEFELWVDTDSSELKSLIAEDPDLNHVRVIDRNPELIGDDTSVNLLIEDFIHRYCKSNEVICQIHVTSPFLLPESLKQAELKIKGGFKDGIDSICSANLHNSRFWMDTDSALGYVPLNHNPLKLEKTQDLLNVYEENSAYYMFTVKSFLTNNNRIGVNHIFDPLSKLESTDIDTEADFDNALNLYYRLEK